MWHELRAGDFPKVNRSNIVNSDTISGFNINANQNPFRRNDSVLIACTASRSWKRGVLPWGLGLLVFCWLSGPQVRAAEESQPVDVVIFGGTPGGIAAALAAGEQGASVLLLEPYRRVGGLMTNGLSHTDFRTFEGLTGAYLQFTQRVQAYYNEKYGADSENAECFRGTHAEPYVNQLLLDRWLSELPNVRVWTDCRLLGVETMRVDEASRRISAVQVSRDGQTRRILGKVFIDGSYEGDLLATAGAPFRVGREGREEFGESLAPPEADGDVQGYNFRFVMTQVPENRVPPSAPEGYRREDFLPLLELFANGQLKSVFCAPSGGIYKYQPPRLPNNKYDINDVSRGVVRLSLPQINNEWPDGEAAVRRRLFQEHLLHQVGMLYFLQHDEAVPEKIRDEARTWGFCRDEFQETDHLPEQLYVREGRRMVGDYIFKEQDTDHAAGDARGIFQESAIALGDYGPNCHGTGHEGPRLGGQHVGEFYKQVVPYQIPYGVLTCPSQRNLLVPVACSSTHVGFCALRLEPIWMSLGEAAGVAARMALEHDGRVHAVPVPQLQRQLHERGAATLYVSDVEAGHPDFVAVQWWGSLGGWHGLAPQPEKPGQRGPHLFGQYFHAFPGHAAELDQPLKADVIAHWKTVLQSRELPIPKGKFATRGDFIRTAHQLAHP